LFAAGHQEKQGGGSGELTGELASDSSGSSGDQRMATGESHRRFLFAEQWSEHTPNSLGHDLLTGDRRMNLVGLIQIQVTADSLEQKRNQRDPVFLCEIRKGAVELSRVIRPEIGRHLHSGEDDFCLWTFGLQLIDDRLEVCLHRAYGQTAQSIVRSPLGPRNVDRTLQ